MAAIVDFGTLDPEDGIYAIYDEFYVRIYRSPGPINPKFKFRIRLTVGGIETILNVSTNVANESIVNPVAILQDKFFRSENNMDLNFQSTLDRSYTSVKIEVGEVYADNVNSAPIFRGYDTDNTLYFFNGYTTREETVFLGYQNYRLPTLYDTEPIKLATLNMNPKVITGDDHYLTYFSYIPFSGVANGLTADTIFVTFKDSAGATISSTSAAADTLSGLGLWYLNIGTTGTFTYPSNWQTAEFYVRYDNGSGVTKDTEVITLHKQEPSPKSNRIRVRYWSQYGLEYFNFTLKNDIDVVVTKGKTVLSDGIDKTATSFSEIKNTSDPERYTFGDSKEIYYNVNSDWLTAEEMEALAQLIDSPRVIMQNEANQIIPIMVETTQMKIIDLRNELKQVSFRFKIANPPKTVKQ